MLCSMRRIQRYRERPIKRVDAEVQRRAVLSLPSNRFCSCGCGRYSDSIVTTGDGSVRAMAFLCAGLGRAAPCATG
jgi:hypothetical protein